MNAAEIQALAASRGIKATQIDPGVWQMEAADDVGAYFEEMDTQQQAQTLAEGRLQARMGRLA